MANITEKQPLLEEQPEEQDLSLSELQTNVRKAQRAYWRAWSRSTSGVWHKRIMISVTALLTLFMLFCMGVILTDTFDDYDDDWYFAKKVKLEAHIMSKCPDAKDCLHDMILPAMQNVSDKVDFQLSYIGSTSEDDEGVICKHGQEECLGNIVELCAAHEHPNPKVYLGFTMCMTKEYEDIPKRELVEDCALEHGLSMEKLTDCTNRNEGSYALEMLRKSVTRSTDANVTKSCTVRLNDEVRCIRDGGEWTDCEGGSDATDLVADIKELYEASRHSSE